jgi:hypothetical protein
MAPPDRLPRWSLAALSLVHALALGVSAWLLPWKPFTAFALGAGLVALGHLATALAAALAARVLATIWRTTSLSSLALFAYLAYATLGSGLYVHHLYEGVGTAILAASIAALAVAVLFTVPLAAWGLAATPPFRAPRSHAAATNSAILGLIVLVAAGFGVAARAHEARMPSFAVRTNVDVDASVARHFAGFTSRRSNTQQLVTAPVECSVPPGTYDGATVFVSYLAPTRPSASPQLRCVQASSLDDALAATRSLLEHESAIGEPLLDVVVERRALPAAGPLIGAVVVRPSLEGACDGGRCLVPHQLVALDAFTEASNVAALQAELGMTAEGLRKRLGSAPGGYAGLDAIATRSLRLTHDGASEPVVHLRSAPPTLGPQSLDEAVRAAGAFIVAAQVTDGRFRYTVDPFTGKTSFDNFSVPRQAGTTLALCEASERIAGAKDAARKSLAMLASLEQRAGDRGGIVHPKGAKRNAPLGSTALTFVALLGCRPLVGPENDALIARLGRTLLASEDASGRFLPAWDPRTDAPVAGKDALYAAGQAVLGLVLWEAAARGPSGATLEAPSTLGDAIDRSMRYHASDYWRVPLRDFFYLEENWHCLAARAALATHRRDDYERFCVDYMEMKKRFIQREESGIDAAHVGAYAFGHVLPPHHAAASGLGESLAASIAVKRARGLDTTDDVRVMERVLGYLLRHQWRERDCGPCTRKLRIAGGFSENVASPVIRIDFVQHAMAAMFHGGRAIGLVGGA